MIKGNFRRPFVVFLADFPPIVGGTTIWYYRIAEMFVKNGYKTYSLGGAGNPPKEVCKLDKKINSRKIFRWYKFGCDLVREIVSERKILFELITENIIALQDLGHIISYLVLIRRCANQLPLSEGIVFCSHANINSLLGYMLCRRHGNLKFVIRCHGSGVIEFGDRRPNMVRFLLNRADYINCLSKYLLEEAIKKGASRGKIDLVYPARDVPIDIICEEKKNIVLFCGYIDNRKDPMTFARAAREIVEKYESLGIVKFVMVGDGSLSSELRKYIVEKKLESHIELCGQLPIKECWEWMRKSKVFVLPSIREPLGAVLVEAMAHKCFCIATRVGGIPELVGNGRGKLFEVGDYKELAMVIADYFRNEQQYEVSILSSYNYVKVNYSFARAFSILEKAIKELVNCCGAEDR